MRRLDELLKAEPVRVVALRAAALGVEAHLVGGAVRDALLGRESHDFDLVVSGRGRELAEEVAAQTGARFVPLGGKEFASFRVVVLRREEAEERAWELDVWDREGGSLDADLARRDFTINAIALAVAPATAGPPIDPFEGIADLERRLLRATTELSFSDDPLRVLRLPRFLVRFAGFEPEPATVELARRSVPGLAAVARERVRDELALIFAGDGAHRGVASMRDLGVYPSLWLGEPGAPVDEAGEQGAAAAVGAVERLSARAEEVARLAAQASQVDPPPVDLPPVDLPSARWALTFRSLAAPPAAAVERLETFRDRGLLTHEAASRVARLVAESRVPTGGRDRRRLLQRLGASWPTALAVFGAEIADEDEPALADWRRGVAELAALVAADGERILDPPRLLSGADVQRLLGLSPGREVGAALDRVRRAQVDGEIASREEAEALLRGGEGR